MNEIKQHELDELRARVERLETELKIAEAEKPWSATGHYTAYYATTGFMLGIFGAITSLLVNVIGAPIAGKDPLELIRVYLTFPLGEKALALTNQAEKIYAIGDGVVLAIGCCLYLGTGMILGIPFQIVLERLAPRGGLVPRLIIASGLSLLLWLFNFYVVLRWLQPVLFGGNWITDPAYLPPWVAAATHLVFGWTMAIVYPLGRYIPYQSPTEKS